MTSPWIAPYDSKSLQQINYNHAGGAAIWVTGIYGLARIIGSCVKIKSGTFIGRVVSTVKTPNGLKCGIVKVPSNVGMTPTVFDLYRSTTSYNTFTTYNKTNKSSNDNYNVTYVEYLTTVPFKGQSKMEIKSITPQAFISNSAPVKAIASFN